MSTFPSIVRSLKIVGMYVFLGPLIIVLGTADTLTRGRSRSWPFKD